MREGRRTLLDVFLLLFRLKWLRGDLQVPSLEDLKVLLGRFLVNCDLGGLFIVSFGVSAAQEILGTEVLGHQGDTVLAASCWEHLHHPRGRSESFIVGAEYHGFGMDRLPLVFQIHHFDLDHSPCLAELVSAPPSECFTFLLIAFF